VRPGAVNRETQESEGAGAGSASAPRGRRGGRGGGGRQRAKRRAPRQRRTRVASRVRGRTVAPLNAERANGQTSSAPMVIRFGQRARCPTSVNPAAIWNAERELADFTASNEVRVPVRSLSVQAAPDSCCRRRVAPGATKVEGPGARSPCVAPSGAFRVGATVRSTLVPCRATRAKGWSATRACPARRTPRVRLLAC
jgi:hypothetical protein